jgi:sec-independent protein translocase protein TatA
MPGPMELIIIFLVILLLFGAKRIPEILKSFGEGVKEFKKGMSNLTDTNSNQQDSASKPAQNQPDSTEKKQ